MSCSFHLGTIKGGLVTMGSSLCTCLPSGSGHDCICDTLLYCYPYQDNNTVPVLSSHAIL